ncbi:MAG TPA: carbon-nitrogen hydrolase family protein [Acidimicrobiales bacterium]|nr:carbon-nitrogen hydrolase family protein [Acidimicrobiales bacterium]
MRVAAVQLATGFDLGENRRLVADRLAAAAHGGAELVVFPEATMATFGDASFDLSSVAEPLDGPFVTTLAEGAARHGVVAVAGMFERAGPAPAVGAGRAFNTVVVVGPDGLLGAYRKLHLFDALGARESDRVLAGDPTDGVVTVPLAEGLVLGVLTCYDVRFPEMARALVDRGATVIALPAHWYNGPGKAEVWETLVRARAIESTAYVVAASKPEDEAVGHSMVVDPLGEVLVELGGKEEDLAFADISPARVSAVRTMLPVLEHRRFGVVPRRELSASDAQVAPRVGT